MLKGHNSGENQSCMTSVKYDHLQVMQTITGKFNQNRGGRVERRCWVNFQCWGVLLVWMKVGRGPIALAVGAGGGCLDIFSLIYLFSFLSPSLWETARYRLKYCLKGPLNPKQPTNHSSKSHENCRRSCGDKIASTDGRTD